VKKILLIALFFIAYHSYAQQGLQMNFTEQDSAQMRLQRQIEYYQLVSGNFFNSNLLLDDIEIPKYDYLAETLSRYTISFDFSPVTGYQGITGYQGNSTGMVNPVFSPFYRNGTVLSAAAYQLGDKFTLGGYSYGTNSIFSAPYPNQGMNNNFDSYGSTLFMQYKVSKKFKIETRINVQQRGHYPGF
jgi:hypothetical protein